MPLCSRFVGKRGLIITVGLSLFATMSVGECVVAKPLRVRQICGEITQERGPSWPGTIRLTRGNHTGAPKFFEQRVVTDDEGRFAFKDLLPGEYELRVTPTGMNEIFVPVLVDLHKSRTTNKCMQSINLKIAFLPEACVSPELKKSPK